MKNIKSILLTGISYLTRQNIFNIFKSEEKIRAQEELFLLRQKITQLTEKENQLQILNVNFRRDHLMEIDALQKKLANKVRDLENKQEVEAKKLNKQIHELKIELSQATSLNEKYKKELLAEKYTHGFLTDGKQLVKIKKQLGETELDLEFKSREIEQKNELIKTLTNQLFALQKQ